VIFGLDGFRKQLYQMAARIPTAGDFDPKAVLEKYLGTSAGESGSIARANDLLGQEPTLAQILSRELRRIMNEDITPATIYTILAVGKFAETLTREIGNEDRIDGTRFQDLSEQLETLKKERNRHITTFKGVLDELSNQAREDFNAVQSIGNWGDVLERVFGTRGEAPAGVKKMDFVGPRELIGEFGVTGKLVDTVRQKFSALITYAMSLLTMTGGAPEYAMYGKELNRILESLGGGTQIILLSQRLQQFLRRRAELREQVVQVRAQIVEFANNNSLDFSKGVSMIDEVLASHPFDEIIACVNPVTEDPRFAGMFRRVHSTTIETNCERSANLFLITEKEVSQTLSEIVTFLDDLIRSVNEVTSALLRRGFKAVLPITDIEECEAAGIHLRNIAEVGASQTVESSASGAFISEIVSLVRTFDSLRESLEQVLVPRSKEEVLAFRDQRKPLTAGWRRVGAADRRIHQHNLLDFRETEGMLGARFLRSVNALLEQILAMASTLNEDLGKKTLSKTLLQEMPILGDFTSLIFTNANQLCRLERYFESVKVVFDELYQVNKVIVHDLACDTSALLDPTPILTERFPAFEGELNLEKQQRVLTPQQAEVKLAALARGRNGLEWLGAYPASIKELLLGVELLEN